MVCFCLAVPGLGRFVRVTRRKLQTPGTTKENNKTKNAYNQSINSNLNYRRWHIYLHLHLHLQITDSAPGTIERAAHSQVAKHITPTSTSTMHTARTTNPGLHLTNPAGSWLQSSQSTQLFRVAGRPTGSRTTNPPPATAETRGSLHPGGGCHHEELEVSHGHTA